MADRNYRGLAKGIGVVVENMQQDQDFQRRLKLAGIEQGIRMGQLSPSFDPRGGFQGFQRTPPPQPMIQNAEEDKRLDALLKSGAEITQIIKTPQGTITIKRGGQVKGQKTVDPTLQLGREAGIESRLQEMEQRNALGAGLAMADRETAFPRPKYPFGVGGGYTDNPPSWPEKTGAFLSGATIQQRPPAPAVPMVDTAGLRQRLDALRSGGSMLTQDASVGGSVASSPMSPEEVALNKPRIQNQDGSVSTERTITIQTENGYINIPTIVNGQQVSPQQAIQAARQSGIRYPTFPTIDAAVQSARQRSDQIGANLGTGGVTPSDVSDLTTAVQRGTIRSKQQAVQVIQTAGFDPSDPAFQEVLSRLR